MELYLFSTPGETGIEYVLDAARQVLSGIRSPQVAYLPAASLHRRWIRETRAAFRGLAAVRSIDLDRHSPGRITSTLDAADLLYIPGGNTYWLAHRLHSPLGQPPAVACQVEGELAGVLPFEQPAPTTLMADLQRRVLAGLPYIGFSAGAVLCGPDILTTNDINACGCTCFDGLGLLPFNLNVHFPADPAGQEARIDRLREYLHFHPERTILAVEDGAALRVADGELHVAQGKVWKIEARKAAVLYV